MVRRVRLDLAYDGTEYHGWQVQPGSRTVQGVLEQALARLQGGSPVTVRGAGRTDAGVHARGQVADALVATRLTDGELHAALLAMLPPDVRVAGVATVPASFHCRHDAVSKTYAYTLDRSRCGDPFLSRFALRAPHAQDDEAMDRALAVLPGTRDWSAFAGAACDVADRVRTVTEARREMVRRDVVALVFTADGFLNHMVRNLVGTVLDVGRGRSDPERVREILERGDRKLAGATAPPHGLSLERVVYGKEC